MCLCVWFMFQYISVCVSTLCVIGQLPSRQSAVDEADEDKVPEDALKRLGLL